MLSATYKSLQAPAPHGQRSNGLFDGLGEEQIPVGDARCVLVSAPAHLSHSRLLISQQAAASPQEYDIISLFICCFLLN